MTADQAVARLSAEQGLGRLMGVHPAKRLSTGRLAGLWFFVVLSVAMVVMIPLAGFFLYMIFKSPNHSKKAAAKQVLLYEAGLIVADVDGPTGYFRYDSMSVLQAITKVIRNGVHVRTDYVFTFRDRLGREKQVTQFYERITDLGAAVQAAVSRAQLPAVFAALDRGEQLQFGDLALHREGIITRKAAIRWQEVQGLDVKNGVVVVKKAGKWLPSVMPVAKIPNFFVFMDAAQRLQRGA
ncbi:MAG: hypothetical protein JWN00_6215 [Actinomycetia bacterium]|jgi:hypothetical protein|nr:hypothetical protein [Actinomycetes bacterium]